MHAYEEKLVEKRIYLVICFDSIACLILINQLSPIFFLQKGTGWLTNGACDIVSREYLRQILKIARDFDYGRALVNAIQCMTLKTIVPI